MCSALPMPHRGPQGQAWLRGAGVGAGPGGPTLWPGCPSEMPGGVWVLSTTSESRGELLQEGDVTASLTALAQGWW